MLHYVLRHNTSELEEPSKMIVADAHQFIDMYFHLKLYKKTPRSRTDFDEWTVMQETVSEWNSGGILESEEQDPKKMKSDLEGFNCKRCDA